MGPVRSIPGMCSAISTCVELWKAISTTYGASSCQGLALSSPAIAFEARSSSSARTSYTGRSRAAWAVTAYLVTTDSASTA